MGAVIELALTRRVIPVAEADVTAAVQRLRDTNRVNVWNTSDDTCRRLLAGLRQMPSVGATAHS